MAPRSEEEYAKIRQQSRENIKDTALELFARQGYHSTTISQIARQAGVSKGLMYNYFTSKEDLVKKLVEEEVTEGEVALEMAFRKDLSPYQRLEMIVDTAIHIVENDVKHWKLVTMLSLQEEIMQQIRELVQQKLEKGMTQFIQLFADLGVPDPETEAYFFGATLDGMFLHYLTISQMDVPYPLKAIREKLLNRYAAYQSNQP